eukprot:scaffold415629_cov15-Prasinocladus_malaysianus.AAC.1
MPPGARGVVVIQGREIAAVCHRAHGDPLGEIQRRKWGRIGVMRMKKTHGRSSDVHGLVAEFWKRAF